MEKKFSKELFADFFAQTQGKSLTKEELDTYVKTFTKYLNTTADEVINSAEKEPTIYSTKKHVTIGKHKKLLGLLIIFASALASLALCLFGGFLLYSVGVNAFDEQTSSTLFLVGCFLLVCTSSVIFSQLYYHLENFYLDYKNARKLRVGDICVWDPNGFYHSFSSEDIQVSPRIVQISAITRNAIYVFCTSDGRRFRVDMKYADMLFKPSTLSDDSIKLIVRYPLSLPMFTFEDCKILEAAMLLAKMKNEPKIYEAIGKVLEKLRFYNEHPYGDYNNVMSAYKQFSNSMQDFIKGMSIEEDYPENDEDEDH